MRRYQAYIGVSGKPPFAAQIIPALDLQSDGHLPWAQQHFLGKCLIFWTFVDLDENPLGRKLNLTSTIDISVPFIVEKKVPAHLQAGPCGEFPKPAEGGVISSLFIREPNADRCWLTGSGVVDSNV